MDTSNVDSILNKDWGSTLTEPEGRKLWRNLVETQLSLDASFYTNRLSLVQRNFLENILGRTSNRLTRRESWLVNNILEQGDYSEPVRRWLNENKERWID